MKKEVTMKVGNTYSVYNTKVDAESVVKVISERNNMYICNIIGDDYPMIFTKEVLKNCELTLLVEDAYPTFVDYDRYSHNTT